MSEFQNYLDGTLMKRITIRHCVSRKNRKFVKKWVNEEHNKLVLVTSRGYKFCQKLAEELQVPFDAICCSSSYIVANNEIIRDVTLGKEIKQIVNEFEYLYFFLFF